jgi:hypothetical protein
MKMTLLEMTQNILSALDSDEVNSISDTIEALQVAYVIKETFDEQFNNIEIPELRGLIKLDGLSDVLTPNYMKVPDAVKDFEWIKYRDDRNNNKFKNVCYMTPEEFLEQQFQYSSSSGDTFLTTDPISGVQYYIKTNKAPDYYTSFDDKYLAFDSYDLDYENTLQSSKSAAFGTKEFSFPLEDTFIPPIDANLFPLLLAEAKSVCFINVKQTGSSKEEQRARRQRIRMQNDQYKSKPAQARKFGTERNFARNR